MAWPTIQISAGTADDTQSSGSRTWSHTCSASSTILLVLVGTGTTSGTDVVTGVTYNSVAMSRVDTQSDGSFERVFIYKLTSSLSSSAQTIAVNYSSGSTVQIFGCAVSADGASTTLGTVSKTTTNADPATLTVVDSANGNVVVGMMANDQGGNVQVYSGTFIGAATAGPGDSTFSGQSQTATGANTVLSWDMVSADVFAAIGVAIKETGGSGGSKAGSVYYNLLTRSK